MQTVTINNREYTVAEEDGGDGGDIVRVCMLAGKRKARLEYAEYAGGYWIAFNRRRGCIEASGYL